MSKNKEEIIIAMSRNNDMTRDEAKKALNAVIDTISDFLEQGEKVQLTGFGFFEVRERAARKGQNPKTKESVDIPACKSVVFKPGKNLKELCNK